MIHLTVSVLLGALGLLGVRGLRWALVVLLCTPFSNAFADQLYIFGLYPYDFYFFALLAREAFVGLHRRRLPSMGLGPLFVVVMPVAYALAAVIESKMDVYYFRDFRPIMYSLHAVTVVVFVSQNKNELSELGRSIEPLIAMGAAFNVLWFWVISSGVVVFQDEFYRANTYRYADLSTYASLVYLTFCDKQRNWTSLLASVLSLISVFLSGFRVMIALLVVVWLIRSSRVRYVILKGALCVVAVVAYVSIIADLGSTRVVEGSTVAGMVSQGYTRFSPFYNLIESADWKSILVGFGHGQTFEVPWFGYRENVGTLSNSIDNTYFTFFAKFGLLSLFYVYFLFRLIEQIFNPSTRMDRVLFFAFVASLSFFYSLPFQATAPGLLVGFLCAAVLNRQGVYSLDTSK